MKGYVQNKDGCWQGTEKPTQNATRACNLQRRMEMGWGRGVNGKFNTVPSQDELRCIEVILLIFVRNVFSLIF